MSEVQEEGVADEGRGNEGRPSISPEDYNRIVSGMDLVNVALNSVVATVSDRTRLLSDAQNLKQVLDLGCSYVVYEGENGERFSIVSQEVLVYVGEKEAPAVALRFQLQLDFNTPEPFTPEFFEVFKNASLVSVMLPYAREFAQSISMRMNIPPIVLPLFKQAYGEPLQEEPQAAP